MYIVLPVLMHGIRYLNRVYLDKMREPPPTAFIVFISQKNALIDRKHEKFNTLHPFRLRLRRIPRRLLRNPSPKRLNLLSLRRIQFTSFHTFANVPVNERSLRVHQVKLVVESGEDFRDGCGVRNHAHGALHFRQIATRNNRRRLVVNAALEASWTPIDELDSSLRLDRSDGGVDILRNDVASVHQAARHVLAVSRITLGHH